MIVNNVTSSQYLGQWIYFRENSAWSGEPIYYSSSSQNALDETRVRNMTALEYEDYAKNYMSSNNKQALLAYRPRSGSQHSSTITESSVKWKTLCWDIKDVSWDNYDPGNDKIFNVIPKVDEIGSSNQNNIGQSIYANMAASDNDWFIYSNKDTNRWLIRYEDIVKTSSSDSSIKQNLSNETTFDDFMSGGSVVEFNNTNMFVGGFLYPNLLSMQSVLTTGKEKDSKYIEVGESLSIPIVFEYYVNSNVSSITKSLYFDLRNSLISDPLHYMIEVTGNYDFSSGNISMQSIDSNYSDSVSTTI